MVMAMLLCQREIIESMEEGKRLSIAMAISISLSKRASARRASQYENAWYWQQK